MDMNEIQAGIKALTSVEDAMAVLVTAWNAAHGMAGGPEALFFLFGFDAPGDGAHPSHSFGTTLAGKARAIDQATIDALPELIAQAQAEK